MNYYNMTFWHTVGNEKVAQWHNYHESAIQTGPELVTEQLKLKSWLVFFVCVTGCALVPHFSHSANCAMEVHAGSKETTPPAVYSLLGTCPSSMQACRELRVWKKISCSEFPRLLEKEPCPGFWWWHEVAVQLGKEEKIISPLPPPPPPHVDWCARNS